MLGPIPGNFEFEFLFYFPKFAAGRKSGKNLLVSGFWKIILETLSQVKSKRIIWRFDRTTAPSWYLEKSEIMRKLLVKF